MKNTLELSSRASVFAAAACALLLAPLGASGGEPATFQVSLSGPQASGDPDGQGQATVTLNPATNEVEVQLRYSNIAEPTAMHIRKGAIGFHGNIAVPIAIESAQGGTLTGKRKSAAPGIIARIAASPQEYYLVVINDEYPVGALRGQLSE